MTTSKSTLLRTLCYWNLGISLVIASLGFGLWISVAYLHTLQTSLVLTFLFGVMIGFAPAMVSVIMISGFFTHWKTDPEYQHTEFGTGAGDGGSVAAAASAIVACL